MKKSFVGLVIIVILMATLPLAAQTVPRGEFAGGYQFARVGGGGGVNVSGWNGAVTGNVNQWFGITGDFGGLYKSIGGVGGKAYTYTGGPELSLRGERSRTFVHALFGGFHAAAGFQGLSRSINGTAMMLGGGVDVRIAPGIAIRAIQFDWLLWHAEGITEKKNARIATGLVLQWGGTR